VAHASEPEEITLAYAGEIVDILQLKSREQMDRLDEQHLWTPPLIDMRFNYKPKNPLYLLTVRAYRLERPVTIHNTPEYAGCKSWVPLEKAIEFTASPVLDDAVFEKSRQRVLNAL